MPKKDIILQHSTLNWYKTEQRLPTDKNSEGVPDVPISPGGVSTSVLVAVSCDNGVEFVAMDSYDPYAKTWERYRPEYGQHVLAWTKVEIPW